MTLALAGLCAAAAAAVAWFALALVPLRRSMSASERRRCFAELPDFLELLGLSLSSGQPIIPAWCATVEGMPPGPLRRELQNSARSLEMGRPGADAMTALARRLADPRVAMALALVGQAMTRGNALEPVLLGQASALRRLRMLDVERRAQTAPLRMMAPVFAFIFPAVLMLLLTPVLLKLAQGGSIF